MLAPVIVIFENRNAKEFEEFNRLLLNEEKSVADHEHELQPVYSILEDEALCQKFLALSDKDFQQQVMSNGVYKMFYRSMTLNFQSNNIQGFLLKAQRVPIFDSVYVSLNLME